MPNKLAIETSPYLRRHMNDPVDWYPWGEAALEKAQREDKPLFISIGYSSCHWCHVMAQESFQDAEVAQLLNRYYVPVKVDREERPDVDSVYMSFCVGLNGSGGWPMTIVAAPDGKPFFAASYIPRENTGGRIGLISLLKALASKWQRDRASLVKTAGELTAALAASSEGAAAEATKALLDAATEQLKAAYDAEYGGFGTAPKFPEAHKLIFLMRAAHMSGDRSLRAMAENTMRQMYRGGIYDHIGGGFCRYSTDREWLAPHFEKMLYDNALLALCYTEAWQDGHLALWRDIAEATLDYCLRELKAERGGFYTSQDADCGGREGAYYFFTPSEVEAVLGAEGKHFCECYDISAEGNIKGESIPNLLLNQRWNMLPEGYDEFREKLRIYREERMSLAVDDKILTSLNGMMLMALSRAAAVFGDRRYLNEALELADFMTDKLYRDGELMACRCRDRLTQRARLDDFAFYALGLAELYAACRDVSALTRACALADEILSRFKDARGGYYLTPCDGEVLIARPKERYDGAVPSGNSAAAVLFDLLARYTGDEKWRRALTEQLEYIAGGAKRHPAGCCFALTALLSRVYGTKELVCVSADGVLPESAAALTKRYAPELTLLLKTEANADALAALAPFTADMGTQNGRSSLYVCENGACKLPIEL